MAEEINAGGPAGEEPTGHIRGIWAVTIIVAAALIVGGGIWYFFYKTTVQDTGNTNTVKLSPSASASTSASASPSTSGTDETASWKTYSNSVNGFSFKYPSTGWNEEKPASQDTNTIVRLRSNESFGGGTDPVIYIISVGKSDSKPTVEYTKGSIAGYTAYITDKNLGRSGTLDYYITKDEKNYIVFSFDPYQASDPFEQQDGFTNTYKQILSTFKFL